MCGQVRCDIFCYCQFAHTGHFRGAISSQLYWIGHSKKLM
uniref:Uncharacterized protein n=1 Tax=Anguilla anguilla TaxID=7936 RepID=A0A0E9TNQ0_ANGAN